MNEVFKVIFSLSCSGALLIVLLRPLCRMRLSKRWQYYIWLVVVARLLLPFAPGANLMGTLWDQIGDGGFQTESTLSAQPNGGAGQPTAPGSANAPAEQPQDKTAESERPAVFHGTNSTVQTLGKAVAAVIMQYLWFLWLIIALVLFIRKVTIYQSFVKYIRAGCVEVEDIGLLERFGGLVAQSGVKAAVDLSVNPLISSPLLIGFFRPRIVLPTTELSDSDFQFTILHELTHFKQLDMFYKWLVQAAVCIHWFNPFAWLMRREVERACELACDETVIRSLDAAGRRAYGDTLLNAIGAGGHYKESVAAVTLCESRQLLSERLAAITMFHKPSRLVRAFSLVLAGVVCVGAVSVGAYSAPTPETKPKTSGDLTLYTAEYTVEELVAADITWIGVNVLSDEITVAQGGDTVKIEYYAANSEEYILVRSRDKIPQAPYNMLWLKINQRQNAIGNRSVAITLPENSPIQLFSLTTTTGNIQLSDCAVSEIDVETGSGAVALMGVNAADSLRICTGSSDALISKTVLPTGEQGVTDLQTQTGMITFLPLDSQKNYRIEVDYGDEAKVIINDAVCEKEERLEGYAIENPDGTVSYPPEALKRINQFTIWENGKSLIVFRSQSGTLRLLEQ